MIQVPTISYLLRSRDIAALGKSLPRTSTGARVEKVSVWERERARECQAKCPMRYFGCVAGPPTTTTLVSPTLHHQNADPQTPFHMDTLVRFTIGKGKRSLDRPHMTLRGWLDEEPTLQLRPCPFSNQMPIPAATHYDHVQFPRVATRGRGVSHNPFSPSRNVRFVHWSLVLSYRPSLAAVRSLVLAWSETRTAQPYLLWQQKQQQQQHRCIIGNRHILCKI